MQRIVADGRARLSDKLQMNSADNSLMIRYYGDVHHAYLYEVIFLTVSFAK